MFPIPPNLPPKTKRNFSLTDSQHRPSLLGANTGSQIAESGLQARVLDTILINATAIFDED
jgi:hypothetical protein